ncbi:hypothetical protein EB796_017247 [Bugula neritina]|uniref:Uncharacterized protein n=1 Tax=Bugula neritina TaxID=10212 RepID=A0A7J7JFP6_BUGNE|nr:hypothetical protein EB796_017247 [Bugula neritina]
MIKCLPFLTISFIIVFLLPEAILSVDVISGPARSYVILSGPLPVRYSFDKILRRSYLSLYKRNSDIEIAQQLVQQVRAGIVQFPCHTVTSPGSYIVKLHKADGTVITSTSYFNAVWPKFNLTIPSSHTAQEDIHPSLLSSPVGQDVACKTQPSELSFFLDVVFSEDSSFVETSVEHQEPNINLRQLNTSPLIIRCEIFDRAGFYQVILREAQHPDVAISTSNVMSVTWGDYYKLSSVQKSIFPCDGQLVVNYTRPKCVRRADNVHMFARISRSMAPVC